MMAELSQIVKELESGKRPKGGASGISGVIPSLGGEHLNDSGGFNLDKLKYIELPFYKSLKKGKIKKNDILIVKDGATTGKISFVGSDFPFADAAVNEHLFILRVDTELASPEYIFQILKSPQGKIQILKDFRGAAIGGISRGFIKRAKIPIPDKEDQIRIAYFLGRIERLILQRKQHLLWLDEFLESSFLSVFGDPVRNDKRWRVKTLGKLLTNIDSGWSPRCESIPATKDEWGVLKLGAITSGEFKPAENKAMLPGMEPKVQHEVKSGDLLFARKNTYELVAATAYVNETRPKLLMPDLIFRLVIEDKNEIEPVFLWKLLSYPSQRKKIQSLAAGAAGSMPNISKAKLNTAEIPVPSIEIQRKFINIVGLVA